MTRADKQRRRTERKKADQRYNSRMGPSQDGDSSAHRDHPQLQRTILDEWDEFVATVGLWQAPAVQQQECKRAFYAGAWAMLNALMDTGESSVSEDDGAAYVEDRRQEILAFYEQVKAGTA